MADCRKNPDGSCGCPKEKNKFEPQCKTKAQVHREWARVLEMCEGTNISPLSCYKKVIETIYNIFDAGFNSSPDCYEFAIAIVEGRPVFRGDALFVCGCPVRVIQAIDGRAILADGTKVDFDKLSFSQPKKTISLIDVPAPAASGYQISISPVTNSLIWDMSFKSESDLCEFANAIAKNS